MEDLCMKLTYWQGSAACRIPCWLAAVSTSLDCRVGQYCVGHWGCVNSVSNLRNRFHLCSRYLEDNRLIETLRDTSHSQWVFESCTESNYFRGSVTKRCADSATRSSQFSQRSRVGKTDWWCDSVPEQEYDQLSLHALGLIRSEKGGSHWPGKSTADRLATDLYP